MAKVDFGIRGLNEVLGEGLQENSTYLITGSSGSGKTIFCLQFITVGINAGENAIYVTVSEQSKNIIKDAKSLGWDLEKHIAEKKLYIMDMGPYTTLEVGKGEALDIRHMVADLQENIAKISAKRVIIESIDYITMHAAESELNAQEYLREMILSSGNTNYTTIFTSGVPFTDKELSIYSMIERLVDGVMTLSIDEQNGKRQILIRKMRRGGVKLSKCDYEINSNGITVAPPLVGSGRLKIGEKAPDFVLDAYYNNNYVQLSAQDYRGKWLILIFYPGDFTFVCPTELSGIAERYEKFKELGAEVISISMNSVASHKSWRELDPKIANIRYPMGSDIKGEICAKFGMLTNDGTTERASVIIDPDCIITSIEMNESRLGRSTDELLRKLEAATYIRNHPNEMCQEGWKPGQPAIKPA